MKGLSQDEQEVFDQDRYELLQQIDQALNIPMAILGFAWLGLLVFELLWGLTPALETLLAAIWIAFIVDFLLKLFLAPKKAEFAKSNWITVIALIVPAFRVFRVLSVLRFARGIALTRIVSSINRSMKALRFTMGQSGFGYVVALASIVALAGSAGMYAFERGINQDIRGFGSALWITATAITIGTDYWPRSPEGMLLIFMMDLFSFAVTGYVTAILASYFIGKDAGIDNHASAEESDKAIEEIRSEVKALREEVSSISELLRKGRRD